MSSEFVLARPQVLRGAAAKGARTAPIDADLSILRPAAARSSATVTTPEQLEAQAREAREEAARIGYEDGYQAGRQEAIAAATVQAEAARTALLGALDGLDAAAAAMHARQQLEVADLEEQIVTIALAMAEAVVGRELEIADTPGRDALVRALALAPERVDAIARLHPDDVATVGDLTPFTHERAVMIVADGAVERGGCVLDVGACRIDAQAGPALQRVREALGA